MEEILSSEVNYKNHTKKVMKLFYVADNWPKSAENEVKVNVNFILTNN